MINPHLQQRGFESDVRSETFEVDPVHSFVLFKASHLGAGYVYGRFTGGLTGTVSTDPAAPDKSVLELQVKTDTLDNGFAPRDKDSKSPGDDAALTVAVEGVRK